MEAVGTDLPVKMLQVAGSESTLPAKIHRSYIRVKVCFRESREIRIDRSLLGFDYSELTGILPGKYTVRFRKNSHHLDVEKYYGEIP